MKFIAEKTHCLVLATFSVSSLARTYYRAKMATVLEWEAQLLILTYENSLVTTFWHSF